VRCKEYRRISGEDASHFSDAWSFHVDKFVQRDETKAQAFQYTLPVSGIKVSQCQNKKGIMITHDAFNAATKFVVGRAGFEPATNGLKVRCSTS
jgi:hypothetical protein